MIPDKLRVELEKPFPPEAITAIASKKYLSTVKAIYILERLNNVFGLGGWKLEHENCWHPFDNVTYALVRGRLIIKEYDYVGTFQFGGHTCTGTGTEIADGWKSAVTDCLSKCASQIGVAIDVFKGIQTHENKNITGDQPERTERKEKQPPRKVVDDTPVPEKKNTPKEVVNDTAPRENAQPEKETLATPQDTAGAMDAVGWSTVLNQLLIAAGLDTEEKRFSAINYFEIDGKKERAMSVISNWDQRIQEYKDTLEQADANTSIEEGSEQKLDWE